MTEHYNQKRKRKAEFIKPINTLKAKVGSGGLSEDILNRAQALLENNTVDFLPLAEIYLAALMKGIEMAKEADASADKEYIISSMLYPGMQLKANGGMFHYPLVTKIADKLIQFLEVIDEADIEVIEIVLAFHTTMRAVVLGRIKGSGGTHGANLIQALHDACMRYFEKNKGNIGKMIIAEE
ncbi:MAG TPA: hypothetical protein DEA55_04450 [Rhodospirillaceae bacterium]|nr:hypothetical protein [Rhodospirillaceae bacterium]